MAERRGSLALGSVSALDPRFDFRKVPSHLAWTNGEVFWKLPALFHIVNGAAAERDFLE